MEIKKEKSYMNVGDDSYKVEICKRAEVYKRGFKGIWIPKEIWLSEDISILEKCLLAEIDSLDNDEGCYASNLYFSEFFGISEKSISNHIKKLKDKGYIYQGSFDGRRRRLHSRLEENFKAERKETSRQTPRKLRTIYKDNNKENNKADKASPKPLLEKETPARKKEKALSDYEDKYIQDAISYLNLKTGKMFRSTTKKTRTLLLARAKESYTISDVKAVIDIKCSKWLNDKKMSEFLRPKTLFGDNFESYLNEAPQAVPPEKELVYKDNEFEPMI